MSKLVQVVLMLLVVGCSTERAPIPFESDGAVWVPDTGADVVQADAGDSGDLDPDASTPADTGDPDTGPQTDGGPDSAFSDAGGSGGAGGTWWIPDAGGTSGSGGVGGSGGTSVSGSGGDAGPLAGSGGIGGSAGDSGTGGFTGMAGMSGSGGTGPVAGTGGDGGAGGTSCMDVVPIDPDRTLLGGGVFDCNGQAPCDDGITTPATYCRATGPTDYAIGLGVFTQLRWYGNFNQRPTFQLARDTCARVRVGSTGCAITSRFTNEVKFAQVPNGNGLMQIDVSDTTTNGCSLVCP